MGKASLEGGFNKRDRGFQAIQSSRASKIQKYTQAVRIVHEGRKIP